MIFVISEIRKIQGKSTFKVSVCLPNWVLRSVRKNRGIPMVVNILFKASGLSEHGLD